MDNGLGQPLIAIRVKDGIFVGNVTAALDEDFLVMNKVTHIVNCCGTEVKDLYEDIGIEYLTFGWRDQPGSTTGGMTSNTGSVMFDQADRNIEQVVRFIDQGVDSGNCVLIHSYFGANRSCALLAAYLIVKYGWKLDNTLAFISLAHSDMAIKPHFMRQLKQFARRHDVALDIFQKDADDSRLALDNDQWMLRNTFLNGLGADTLSRNELYQEAVANTVNVLEPTFKTSTKRRRRILFIDTKQGTAVGSQVSQPLAPSKHQDPHVMMNDQHAPGTPGRNSILSRRASPNNRRLESPSDVNPRGRLMLTPRRNAPENGHHAAPQQQQHGNMSDPEEPEDIEPQQRPLAGGSGGDNQPFQRTQQQQQPSANSRMQPPQHQQPPQQHQQQQPQRTTGGQGTIRNPFALSYTGGGQVRKGSPLPLQRQARGGQRQEDGAPYNRNPAAPSSTNQLRSDGQPQPRTNSPIKRQVGRAESPRPITNAAPNRTDSFTTNRDRLTTSGGGTGSGQPRAGSPMGSRLVFQSHPSIPNANSTIVTNSQLRSTASVRPYTASPMSGGSGRADSPMGRRTTVGGSQVQSSRGGGGTIENTLGRNSPRGSLGGGAGGAAGGNRLSSPQVLGNRAGSPQVRTGSPMSRGGATTGAGGGRPMSLADQYLSGGGGSTQPKPRETTASLLRRQQNLSAHRY